LARGDVLEHGERVDEVDRAGYELREAAAVTEMQPDVGNAFEVLRREGDHLVGDIDAVEDSKMPAQRLEQASRAAADLNGDRSLPELWRPALQLGLEESDLVCARCEELFLVLISAAEGDEVVGVFARAIVPVVAHRLARRMVIHMQILAQRTLSIWNSRRGAIHRRVCWKWARTERRWSG